MKPVLFLLLSFPLLGALILAGIGRHLSRRTVETIACTAVVAAFVLALTAFLLSGQKTFSLSLAQWFAAGSFQVDLDLYYDPLSAVMALMVTFVSSLVHLYSVGYMRHENGYIRYFCFLNLFVFAMLVIVTAGNLVFLYLGWEMVGFCSYALIGFWYEKPEAVSAGAKAFIVTRLGDVAFGIAIALCWTALGHLSVPGINDGAADLGQTAGIIGCFLLLAAIGKSAQIPLAVWLPDAMAGPTPVSALIHAATMVTAGVYLLMRFFPIIQGAPLLMAVTASVGVITVCFGAFAALVQKDIKRILAYSTISQVGYMFLALGAGDMAGSLFHLISHAFFKSLLFLGAGCIIQSLHEEQDIFRMGGLRQKMPQLFWLFLAGTAALGAFPLTAGFFSKDRILLAVFLQPQAIYKVLWVIAAVAAAISPLYAFRLFFVVFFSQPHASEGRQPVAPIPGLMTWTLWPLAAFSVLAGLLNLPVNWAGNEWLVHYLAAVPGASQELHASIKMESVMQLGSALVTIFMVIGAWIYYGIRFQPDENGQATFQKKLHALFLNGFYLDRLYQKWLIAPWRTTAVFFWQKVDTGWIDAGLDQSALSFLTLAEKLRLWTTGRVTQYVTMMVTGFTLILCGLTVVWWVLQI